jgi:hypothetical protein
MQKWPKGLDDTIFEASKKDSLFIHCLKTLTD